MSMPVFQIQQLAQAADALAVHDVELRLPEGGGFDAFRPLRLQSGKKYVIFSRKHLKLSENCI